MLSLVISGSFVYTVAPFVGAWIEIGNLDSISVIIWSLRSSERGLKSNGELAAIDTWKRRSVRRSVD